MFQLQDEKDQRADVERGGASWQHGRIIKICWESGTEMFSLTKKVNVQGDGCGN